MKNKIITYSIVIFCSILFILQAGQSHAGNASFGLSAGPALGFNSDFNGENTKSGLHFSLGADILYRMPCHRGTFCKSFFVGGYFNWLTPSTYHFNSTQVKDTGIVGNFSEKQFAYAGGIFLRKDFFAENKFHLFTGIGLGFEYFQISESKFQDFLGNDLELDTTGSSLNLSLVPQIGLNYQISHKLSFEISTKAHMAVPMLFRNSYLEFPITLRYSF